VINDGPRAHKKSSLSTAFFVGPAGLDPNPFMGESHDQRE